MTGEKRVTVLVTLNVPEYFNDEQVVRSIKAHLLPGKAHAKPTITVVKDKNEQAR